MTTATRLKTTEEIVYIANDGKEFSNAEQCIHYEWTLTATEVFLVTARGQRSDNAEVYSTYELAEKAINGSTAHSITQVYLDERFWNAS